MRITPSKLRRAKRRCALACVLALLPLLAGCGLGDRVAECNQLARTLNVGLEPVRAYIAANPGVPQAEASPKQYEEVEALYSSLANSLDAAELGDEKLSELKQSFSQMFAQTAAACRDLSRARSSTDDEAKSRAKRELLRLERREESLHGRTRGYCTAP